MVAQLDKIVVKFAVEEVKIMKFCDKLSNLRKQNNMSQEQLADKLGVSRQAVSKWESGSSIPDMEKIMQLCKTLNCSLEELVDDGIGGSTKSLSDGHATWNDYYKEILDFITKTLNMFWSMRLVEKVKCILEMLFITFLIWFIWGIIGNMISSSFYPILSLLPNLMYSILHTIISLVYRIFGIVVGFVLLVHIFKIRYLDYFITIEDAETTEKKIEAPIEEEEKLENHENSRKFIEKKKNKIIIRDPKHSTYSFFGVLAKMVIWFIKFLLILFAIPCIFCFIGITFMDIFFLWNIKDGLFFFGIFLSLLGGLIINYLVLKCIYHFILELKYPAQKIFLCFIIGLILIGSGSAISFCNYLTFDKIDFLEETKTTKTIKDIEVDNDSINNLVLEFLKQENIKIVEDNSLKNVHLEIEHYNFLECSISMYRHYSNIADETGQGNIYYQNYNLYFYDDFNFIDEFNFIINKIRDKKRIDFHEENNYQVTVYASSDMIQILENNYQKFYE